MDFGLPVLGAVLAAGAMLVLATKWRLPKRVSLIGIAVIAFVTAVPFAWIYPLATTTSGLAAVVLCQVLVALIVAMLVLLQRFWRDPERIPPETGGVVLSPADGVVEYIWDVADGSMTVVSKGGKDYQLDELTGTNLASAVHVVGVGMSFLDVHVNRCPIPGRITLTKHIAGSFLSLGREEAQFVNERFTTVIESRPLNVAIVQIASRLVRRIESYLTVGETVEAGQRLGMIRLGSLVAIVIPKRQGVRVEVELGQRVTAGVSILASYDER